jgi:hypothetical protein
VAWAAAGGGGIEQIGARGFTPEQAVAKQAGTKMNRDDTNERTRETERTVTA